MFESTIKWNASRTTFHFATAFFLFLSALFSSFSFHRRQHFAALFVVAYNFDQLRSSWQSAADMSIFINIFVVVFLMHPTSAAQQRCLWFQLISAQFTCRHFLSHIFGSDQIKWCLAMSASCDASKRKIVNVCLITHLSRFGDIVTKTKIPFSFFLHDLTLVTLHFVRHFRSFAFVKRRRKWKKKHGKKQKRK